LIIDGVALGDMKVEKTPIFIWLFSFWGARHSSGAS